MTTAANCWPRRCGEIDKRGIQLANIEPGKPWQNGSNESFNGTFRRECLNAEIFASLTEARVVIEQWLEEYNTLRPHGSLGGRSPAQFVEDWANALPKESKVNQKPLT